ncbi:MAG: hypothetical protein CSA72_04960 [Rhodobacterales bacterium]|nr:MAG: hypothetical protein CSA72_04960 [Rhodobacterales bacterium]
MYQAHEFDGNDVASASIPAVGMLAQTTVLTRAGVETMGDLSEGSFIITREYGLQRVGTIERAQGIARLIHIAPDAIAPGKPSAALTVGEETLIFMESGPSRMPTITEAGDLVNGSTITDAGYQSVELVRPKFDEGRIVYADGLELVCTPF